MNYIFIFFVSTLFSLFAIAGLFIWKIKKIRLNPNHFEEARSKAAEPLFGDSPEQMRILARGFIRKIAFHPSVLRVAEILIRRIRLLVLRIENFLFGLIDYLNGRRRIHKENGGSGGVKAAKSPSLFLEELNNSKKSSEKNDLPS